MAFRLFHRAEIGHHLARLHHDLAQQQRARADDLADHAHQAHQLVYLGEVAAVGAEFLPDVGHGVQADDVHAPVAEIEHVLRHIVEYRRVGVVQVPLVGIEGRHDDLAGLLAPAEVAGRGGREDLGHGFFKFLRDAPVVVEEIALLHGALAGAGAAGPFVVLARVVHHEIEADGDPPAVALVREGGEVLHCTQLRLHLAEVRDGIAAVAAALGAFEQRHQVQVIDAAVLDVIQLLPHTAERFGEGIDIHQHADQLVPLVPGGIALPGGVERAKLVFPRCPHAPEHIDKEGPGLLVVVVQLEIELFEFAFMPRKAGAENRAFVHRRHRLILPFSPPDGSSRALVYLSLSKVISRCTHQ